MEKFSRHINNYLINYAIKGIERKLTKTTDAKIRSELYREIASKNYEIAQFEESNKSYLKGIKENPHNVSNHLGLATNWYNHNNPQAAILVCKKCIRINKYSEDLLYCLAAAYDRRGAYRKEIAVLKKLCRVSGAQERYIAPQALAYARLGNKDKALEGIKKHNTLKNNVLSNSFIAGNIALILKDHQAAKKGFLAHLKKHPKDINAHTLLASCHEALQDYEAAINNYSMAIKLAPKEKVHYRNRGRCYQICRIKSKAISDIEKSVALGMNDIHTHYSLALLLVDRDINKAAHHLKKVVQLNKNYEASVELLETLTAMTSKRVRQRSGNSAGGRGE